MSTLDAAWALARKDLKLFFRDRTAMLLTLALPIVLATVFGAAMGGMSGGGGGQGSPRIDVLVEDADHSTASESLIASLERSRGIRPVVGADARRKVSNGDFAAALVVPAGYGAALDAGEVPSGAVTLARRSAFLTRSWPNSTPGFLLTPWCSQRATPSRGDSIARRSFLRMLPGVARHR